MAQSGSGGNAKLTEAQENFLKTLLMRCKSENEKEEAWTLPEMVGYYGEVALPTAQVHTSSVEEPAAVKKLVCSPDLALEGEAFRCQVCDKMYTTKAAFASHARTHAKETEDPYRCDICAKTFAVPARLTRHYRTHTGEKPFKCEFCSKSFSVKENLSVHRRIHTKERPYKCEVCARAFEHSGKLHRHMRIHTGERPHKCSVCLKTFIQSGQLVIHMRTHTGEKPYVCTVCQKGFTCSKQLKVHSRTHTGEKPYSCEICGKSFGYNHVLKLHQVAHYGEKVYKCTICNDTFNSKKSMEAHIKSHSDGVPPQPPTPPASSTSESSCSSGSDVETFKDLPMPLTQEPTSHSSYDPDVRYVVYTSRDRMSPPQVGSYSVPPTGVDLLAAAATTVTERDEIYRSTQDVLNLIKSNPACLRHPAYFTPTAVQYTPLTACDGLRRRVEAVLAVEGNQSEDEVVAASPTQLLSPPVSPTPLLSPPVSPAAQPDPELSLPPRKRSKMILKSMESSIDLSPVRYSSVIHYAGAS